MHHGQEHGAIHMPYRIVHANIVTVSDAVHGDTGPTPDFLKCQNLSCQRV